MRGLHLLELIGNGKEGVPVRQLAAAMGVSRSIVQRLLYTLEGEGFIEKHPSRPGYRLSIKVWALGSSVIRKVQLREVARPCLEELAYETKETAKLGVLDGQEVVYIDGVDGPQTVRAYIPVGGRAPSYSMATGKAILAFLPAQTIDLGRSVSKFTGKTVVSKEALAKQLEQVRRRGYAVNLGEWEDGVGAVAAPVRNADGDVIASIGVIAPINRLPRGRVNQIGALILRSAANISAKLGYQVLSDGYKRASRSSSNEA